MAAREPKQPPDRAFGALAGPFSDAATTPNGELRLTDPLPSGRLVVEASAGTGKTYSLTALLVRHLAEGRLTPAGVLVVTYTRAAAAELRDRMRRGLIEARDALEAGGERDEGDWLSTIVTGSRRQRSERRTRLEKAIANFDEATISTIHGFCQQALSQLGLRSGSLLESELVGSTAELVDEVCRDVTVNALWAESLAASWEVDDERRAKGKPARLAEPSAVFARLVETVTTLIANPLITVLPSASDLGRLAPGESPAPIRTWVAMVHEAAAKVKERQRARRRLGYDDLIASLHRAVTEGPQAAAARSTLRDRYALVLVDEFQDTDPLQWSIFEAVFEDELVTVGDPKQAIYRFRGADVHAYLEATAAGTRRSLRTNYRSDRGLVTATNVLVEGVELGHRAIVAEAVKAAGHALDSALSTGTPLVIRHLRHDPSLAGTGTSKNKLAAPLARRAILADMVSVVVDLLDHEVLRPGQPDERVVTPGDIAVLVPSHSNADEVVQALADARVPAVRSRTGSVFDTPAALEWRLLLEALERPSHTPTVRAAALGLFFHCAPSAVDPRARSTTTTDAGVDSGADAVTADYDADTDSVMAALQAQCAGWSQEMPKRPFLGWYDRVRAASGVVEHLLARPDGERILTDLDHIAELLATESAGGCLDASTARRRLDAFVGGASSMSADDAMMRRIDSDAEAVQVSTIHGSKGLEYPVVLLPFSWTTPPAKGARVYNEPSGRRVVDVASMFDWDGDQDETRVQARQHYEALARQGDQLRLMYVALTRAKHRTVVWVAQTKDSARSALNLMLFHRDADGNPLPPNARLTKRSGGLLANPTVSTAKVDDSEVAAHLETLRRRSGGTIGVAACPPRTRPVLWLPKASDASTASGLSVADPGGRTPRRRGWGRWSFSSIHASAALQPGAMAQAADLAVAGGADEPLSDQGEGSSADGLAGAGQSPVSMPLARMVAGAAFGTMVHEVLQRVDPTAEPLTPHLRAEIDRAVGWDRMAVDRGLLADGLAAAIRTPLGTIAGGRSLSEIPVRDRLAELDFELSLCRGTGSIPAARIGEVLQETLADDDPQQGYADTLAEGRFDLRIGGFLRGSIDAVLRVEVDGALRHIVVDYKTNRLHAIEAPDPLAAYHPGLLPAAMAASDYVLQGLLYSVAVHRFLRGRLRDYSPSVHLGGIAYLYLRGMVGRSTPVVDGQPYGVFAWQPPVATIEALDTLLASGAWR